MRVASFVVVLVFAVLALCQAGHSPSEGAQLCGNKLINLFYSECKPENCNSPFSDEMSISKKFCSNSATLGDFMKLCCIDSADKMFSLIASIPDKLPRYRRHLPRKQSKTLESFARLFEDWI